MRAACSRQQPMQHHPRKRNATAKAAEGNLGGFCVAPQKSRVRWIWPLFFCDTITPGGVLSFSSPNRGFSGADYSSRRGNFRGPATKPTQP
jgi:hypothetical protein